MLKEAGEEDEEEESSPARKYLEGKIAKSCSLNLIFVWCLMHKFSIFQLFGGFAEYNSIALVDLLIQIYFVKFWLCKYFQLIKKSRLGRL